MLGGPSLAARLLPLVAVRRRCSTIRPRALRWMDLLLAEDPTSPDVLELAALVFGRARRYGGTERMLMELAYTRPIARRAWPAARRSGIAWAGRARPARSGSAPHAGATTPRIRSGARRIACARRDPGAGNWREIRGYVLGRAKPERREALAAALDGNAGTADGGAGVATAAVNEDRERKHDSRPQMWLTCGFIMRGLRVIMGVGFLACACSSSITPISGAGGQGGGSAGRGGKGGGAAGADGGAAGAGGVAGAGGA